MTAALRMTNIQTLPTITATPQTTVCREGRFSYIIISYYTISYYTIYVLYMFRVQLCVVCEHVHVVAVRVHRYIHSIFALHR